MSTMSLRKIFAETNNRQGEVENKTAVVNQGVYPNCR
jgi:hypothetical protein